jgi:prolyl oligopeptidase
VITGLATAGHRLYVTTLENVQSKLRIYEPSGALVRDVAMPSLGSLGGVSGDFEQDDVFFSFSSLAWPTTVYRYETASGKREEWARLRTPVDPESVEIKQVFFASKDGTRVPMFVAHKRGLTLDGRRPTLLTGYGGFNVSQNPGFSLRAAFWIENGGVYALPNLRGGGEFGEAWHKAGMLANKQNVFDDFIGAAEWLIANKYTSPERSGHLGRLERRPAGGRGDDAAPRADLQRSSARTRCSTWCRYHQFLVAGYWVPEYGSAEDAQQLPHILKYSPYHNVNGDEVPRDFVHHRRRRHARGAAACAQDGGAGPGGERVGQARAAALRTQGRSLRRRAGEQDARRPHRRDGLPAVADRRRARPRRRQASTNGPTSTATPPRAPTASG